MGFSITGMLIAISILIPNLLLVRWPPRKVPDGIKDAGIMFTALERVGQIGCLSILTISKGRFEGTAINIWFAMFILCVVVYYGLWIRYVVKGQDFSLLFKPLVFIPIPMAIFPIFAFGFAAMWGQSLWLGIAVVILAVGHLVNSWHTYKFYKWD